MSINDMVQKTVESGISPLELTFEKVSFYDSKKVILRSILTVNSLELGKLTPTQYRVVAGRGKQGGALLGRQVQKVFEAYPALVERFGEIDCITIPILSRTLMEGFAASIIFEEFERNATVPPDQICFELSSDLLFEGMESVKERFDELRDLKTKLAICELGDEFCPIFRLRELAPFDLAFADPYSFAGRDAEDESVKGLPEYIHMLGARVIAPGVSEEDFPRLRAAGYDGCSLAEDVIDLNAPKEEVTVDEEQ